MRYTPWLVHAALLGVMLGATGCADVGEQPVRVLEQGDQALGSVTLALQATSGSGKVYRLRNASFALNGPSTVTLQTPSPAVDDSEPFLQTTLLSGNYTALLEPGFQVWRIAPDGSEGVVPAELISANPVEFQVTEGNETPIVFRFSVEDDGRVSFGSGSARVEIEVSEGDTSCTPVNVPDLPDDDFIDANCDGIDGDISEAVFVAADGDDSNPGTPASPVRTLAEAFERSASDEKGQILVSAGTYTGLVQLANGVHVYGGYSRAAGWDRSDANVVTLEQSGGVPHNFAVRGTDITAVTVLDRLTIRSGFGATGAGASNYGVHCTRCRGLVLSNVDVRAAAGGNGNAGPSGAPGAPGGNGNPGAGGLPDSSGSVPGGNPGDSSCGRSGGRGGNGGIGANGGGAANGQPGLSGAGGTPGGAGGSASAPGNPSSAGQPGAPGQEGQSGAPGPNGAGAPAGNLDSGLWSAPSGLNGFDGQPGNGGGGGGGGGGQDCQPIICQDGTGNGGGGGGAGGCGGRFGAGGSAAGGSFAVVLVDSSGATLRDARLESAAGGRGGNGGNGGSGGNAGFGGAGGSVATGEVGAGGPGGRGGFGGFGGHGGGGAGGSSHALVTIGTATTLTDVVMIAGPGGAGGSSPGLAGAPGSSAPTLNR